MIIQHSWKCRALPSGLNAPSYETLLEENRRLKSLLESSDTRCRSQSNLVTVESYINKAEQLENALFKTITNAKGESTVSSWADILPPTRDCMDFLVTHALEWSLWTHYAVHMPSFTADLDSLWSTPWLENLADVDPFRLAVLFAFLSVCRPSRA